MRMLIGGTCLVRSGSADGRRRGGSQGTARCASASS